MRLLGTGGLVAGSALAGHVATALPSEAAEVASRENGAYAGTDSGRQEVLWSVTTKQPLVALTFDDGPTDRYTPRVLDLLAAAGARATFFVVGQQVARAPGLVRAMVAAGHEIGNHTWGHHSAAMLTAADTARDIEAGTAAIVQATSAPPVWYRPPRGMLTGSAALEAHRRNQRVAMWSVDRGPAGDTDLDGVRRHLVASLAPGAVIDLHDGVGAAGTDPETQWPAKLMRRRETELAVLPDVLAAGRRLGLRFVTLTRLVATNP